MRKLTESLSSGALLGLYMTVVLSDVRDWTNLLVSQGYKRHLKMPISLTQILLFCFDDLILFMMMTLVSIVNVAFIYLVYLSMCETKLNGLLLM
jgi:hypothetical protein